MPALLFSISRPAGTQGTLWFPKLYSKFLDLVSVNTPAEAGDPPTPPEIITFHIIHVCTNTEESMPQLCPASFQ